MRMARDMPRKRCRLHSPGATRTSSRCPWLALSLRKTSLHFALLRKQDSASPSARHTGANRRSCSIAIPRSRGKPTLNSHRHRETSMAGLYFEQFYVGQKFEHAIRRTVTEADNVFFTALTHNPAALHLDEEYGKATEFGQRIVNSLFTLGLMIGISVHETTLGTT